MAVMSYKCPNCGGGLTFDPKTQKLMCEYCLSEFTEDEMEKLEGHEAAAAGAAGVSPPSVGAAVWESVDSSAGVSVASPPVQDTAQKATVIRRTSKAIRIGFRLFIKTSQNIFKSKNSAEQSVCGIHGTPNGNRTHNCPLGGGCYIHLTMEAYAVCTSETPAGSVHTA